MPNNALQRTEAGGRVFSVFHVLRRQPPSLSLGPLGTTVAISQSDFQPDSTRQRLARRSFGSFLRGIALPDDLLARFRVAASRQTIFWLDSAQNRVARRSFGTLPHGSVSPDALLARFRVGGSLPARRA